MGLICHRDGAVPLPAVRVMPCARRSAITGTRDGRLLVRLQAPPVEGSVNDALAQVIASAFGVKRSAVAVEAGEHSRDKRLRVHEQVCMPTKIPGRA